MGKPKLCLACSAGGHLTELMQLKPFYSKYPHYFVSHKGTNALALSQKEKVYFVVTPIKNPFKVIINFFQALKIFLKEKPDIVISTGSDTAVPTCFLAKLFGKKLVFIESFACINNPSLSGKLLYRWADLFFLQWKENRAFYPKGIFAGSVFE